MTGAPEDRVTWFQIPADEPDRAWKFYSSVFGWDEADMQRDRKVPGAINGEITSRTPEITEPRLVIRVADLDDASSRIVDAGGEVIGEKTVLKDIGMAFVPFRDSEGNVLNLVSDA